MRILASLQESLCLCSSQKDVSFNGTQDKECGAQWIRLVVPKGALVVMQSKNGSFNTTMSLLQFCIFSPHLVSRLLPLGTFLLLPHFIMKICKHAEKIDGILQQTPSDSAFEFFNLHFTLPLYQAYSPLHPCIYPLIYLILFWWNWK